MNFFKSELKYLGYIVSGSGVKQDQAKVEIISQWPTPSSVHEVRQFSGLADDFRKFIRRYVATASPLTDLLKSWSKEERVGVRDRCQRDSAAAVHVAAALAPRWTQACSGALEAI